MKFKLNFGKKKDASVFLILKDYWKLIGIVWLFGILAYANSIPSGFAIVDDMPTIVTNRSLFDFIATLNTHNLQLIIYSIIIKTFGANPIPFRILSILMHLSVATFLFVTIQLILKNKWVSFMTAALFVIHPITTETISWISASAYLYTAIFFYLTLIPYILHKQRKNKNFLWLSITLYSIGVFLNPSPWILVIPIAIVVIDQFILNDTFSLKSLRNILIYAIPIIVFMVPVMLNGYQIRLEGRTGENPTQLLRNEQALTPVIESYPYTTTIMLRQYLFPKDLSMYYDGQEITNTSMTIMYIVMAIYIGLIIYTYRKYRKICGLLILLPVLILPSYSPQKLTWTMAERYLYIGTAVISLLISLFIYNVFWEKKKKVAFLLFVIITLIFLTRTTIRNLDWRTPPSLAAATMKTAPLSARPYADLGSYYLDRNDRENALINFIEAINRNPLFGAAVNNIGYIYLNEGLPETPYKYTPTDEIEDNYEFYMMMAQSQLDKNDGQKALYFLSRALEKNPTSFDAITLAGGIYLKANNYDEAYKTYSLLITEENTDPELLYILSYIHFLKGEYPESLEKLEQIGNIQPDYPQLQESIDNINQLIEDGKVIEVNIK